MNELMNGVIILAEKERTYYGAGWSVFVTIGTIITIFLIILMIISIFSNWKSDITLGYISCIFFAITLTIALGGCPKYKYIEYKVIIDDNVTFNELYKDYDIIDNEGSIIVLHSREQLPLKTAIL